MSQEVIARAESAQRLLGNSDFLEIFDHVKRELFAEWSGCRDGEKLKEIHTEMVGMDRLFKKIATYRNIATLVQHNESMKDDQ